MPRFKVEEMFKGRRVKDHFCAFYHPFKIGYVHIANCICLKLDMISFKGCFSWTHDGTGSWKMQSLNICLL